MIRLVAGSAVVTGGGSGIGGAIAESLAREGTPVGVVDLWPEGVMETVAAIARRGWSRAAPRGGRQPVGGRRRRDRWCGGRARPARHHGQRRRGPRRLRDGRRALAATGSASSRSTCRAASTAPGARSPRCCRVGGVADVAAKHGLVGLTRRLATTYADRGITVDAICPGPIATALRPNSARILGPDAPPMRGIGGDEAAIRAVVPAGRRGTVEDVAAAACYLASEAAGYVTGHTLVVDGGWTAR